MTGQKGPALRVSAGSPSDYVTLLDRVADPRCAAFLAEKLPAEITVDQIYRTTL